MTTEILFRKRVGREGEMGLFVETPVFEEEWTSLKIGAEVKAICTVPANLRYVKFFHALCGKVAENCDWLIDKDDAKERILLEARHYKTIHDPLRDKTEIKAKSVAGLSGDQWIRLLRRCTHVVVTKFIPGMEEGPLKAEIEAMIGPDLPASAPEPKPARTPRQRKQTADPQPQEPAGGTAGNANPAAPSNSQQEDSAAGPAPPQNEAEYTAACHAWLKKQTNRHAAFDYFNGAAHRQMRIDLKVSTGTRKSLERAIGEFFDAKDKADAKGQTAARAEG